MRQSRGRGSKVKTEARPCEAEARPSQLKNASRPPRAEADASRTTSLSITSNLRTHRYCDSLIEQQFPIMSVHLVPPLQLGQQLALQELGELRL